MSNETATVTILPEVLKGPDGREWRKRVDQAGWLRWQVFESGGWRTKVAVDRAGNLYLTGVVVPGYTFTD